MYTGAGRGPRRTGGSVLPVHLRGRLGVELHAVRERLEAAYGIYCFSWLDPEHLRDLEEAHEDLDVWQRPAAEG